MRDIANFKVWLKASISVRAKRIAGRDKISVEKARDQLIEKERLEQETWRRIYGFDYKDMEKEADLVIDVSDQSPIEIVDRIIRVMPKG